MFTEVKTTSVAEAMEAAGHNFEVEMVPLVLPDGTRVPDKRAVVKKSSGAYLSTVGKDYVPIQPVNFYEVADQLVQKSGGVIDKALTMREGAVMGLSITMGDTEYLPGDPVERTFLMMTSFDYSYSLIGRAISNRWFCMNQLPSSSHIFNIKHTTHALDRLKTSVQMLGYYQDELAHFDVRMRLLARSKMPDEAAVKWFGGLLPPPAEGSQRSTSIRDNTVAKYVELLHTGLGTNVPGVRGTAYGALNAMTEYANHHRSTRVREGRKEDEVRFETVTFGTADGLMQRGVKSLLKLVR